MKDIRHIAIMGSGKETLASVIIESCKNVTVLDVDNKKSLKTVDLDPYIPEPKNFINGKKLPKKRN